MTELEQIINTIKTLQAMNLTVDEKLLQRKADLEAEEKAAASSSTPIYDRLIKEAEKKFGSVSDEKKRCVEQTVAKLLEDGPRSKEPGLLLGRIQCGKTDTFENVIGLAFDKGVDVAVVLTNGTVALGEQTYKRFEYDYRFFKEESGAKNVIEIYNIHDFKGSLKEAVVDRKKVVFVCMKQVANMRRLTELFVRKSSFLKDKNVLIVDDEADFASRNYVNSPVEICNDEDGNPILQEAFKQLAVISDQIDRFRHELSNCHYLQVTATPYSLFLQPGGDLNLQGNMVYSFKPRFVSQVPVHSRYIGGDVYYVQSKNPDSMYSHLFTSVPQKCMDVMKRRYNGYLNEDSRTNSSNLYELSYALVSYFMATAIRVLQTRNERYKTCAVFHVDIAKDIHSWQKDLIDALLEDIESYFAGDLESEPIESMISQAYTSFGESNKKGNNEGLIDVVFPSLDEIKEVVNQIFVKNDYSIYVVNSDKDLDDCAQMNKETGQFDLQTKATIFIGGNILNRGITIDNMICFFYGRDTNQQDTVMQHARFYGARSKEDMAVTRLHTTNLIYNILTRMHELDEDLRTQLMSCADGEVPSSIFVGYDQDFKPCASSKIAVSKTIPLRPGSRIFPIGFMADFKTYVKPFNDEIRSILSPYGTVDYAEIPVEDVRDILYNIRQTYLYGEMFENEMYSENMSELQCALDYATKESGGKIKVKLYENREINRVRLDGGFEDSPESGNVITSAKAESKEMPVLVLLHEKGEKNIDPTTGKNKGWNGGDFYWPVLYLQESLKPSIFALDTNSNGNVFAIDYSEFYKEIGDEECLRISYPKELCSAFGEEGQTYEDGEKTYSVHLTPTNASRYVYREGEMSFALNYNVDLDKSEDNGIFSYCGGQFPFELRDFRYLLVKKRIQGIVEIMLLELYDQDSWEIISHQNYDSYGDLIGYATNDTSRGKTVLLNTGDVVRPSRSRDPQKRVCQWEIIYKIKKVVMYRQKVPVRKVE